VAATAASTSEPRLDGVAGRLQPEAAGARLSELFTRHASMVVGVCRGMLRHREEAEDAAQQTFLAAYKALLGGTKPREPAAWLATIARNECRRRITDRMRAGVPIGTVEETLADHATPISPADVSALREAIAGLPPMQQRAILLREFVGLSYDEVAQELAVTEPAVESLLFRARRTLQARLRPALGAAFGVGPIPALREALAQIVPGFTASSGGGIAALASLPAAAKLAAGVATIGLVAGGTVVAVEVERGPRHQPKPPAVLPLAGADVAAAGLVARPRALSLAAVSAPDSRRGRLGAGAARRGEQARGIRVQPLVTLTATSQGSRAPVDAPFSGASDTPAAPNESAGSAPPVSSSEPGASAPVAPASPATEQPTSSTPPKDEGQSGPSGGAADDDDHSGPGGGEPGEDEDHSGPGGGGDGEDHSGPGGGGGEGDDDVSGESGSSSGSSGSGTGEEPDQESSDSSGSGSSGSGSSGSGSDSGSSESSGSGSSGSGSGSGSGEDDGD
jgi:RNA polymerase sigma factor (sigma-70 family)